MDFAVSMHRMLSTNRQGEQTLRHMTLIERHKPYTAAAAALFLSQTELEYSLRSKPAPTDFDLQPNSHAQS